METNTRKTFVPKNNFIFKSTFFNLFYQQSAFPLLASPVKPNLSAGVGGPPEEKPETGFRVHYEQYKIFLKKPLGCEGLGRFV